MMVTIQDIKKIAEDARNKKMQKEKELIIQKYILPAASEGRNFCVTNENLDDEVIAMLKADGYKVYYYEEGYDYTVGDYWVIEWK